MLCSKQRFLQTSPLSYLLLSHNIHIPLASALIPFTPTLCLCLYSSLSSHQNPTPLPQKPTFVIQSSPITSAHLPSSAKQKPSSETNRTYCCSRNMLLESFKSTKHTADHLTQESWQHSHMLHAQLPTIISPRPLCPSRFAC